MTIPNLADLAAYEPRWPGVRELNLGDAWRARWVEGEPLPAGLHINHLYATVLFEARGYLCRPAGTETWDTLEGRPDEGEKPDAFLKRVARDRFGADLGLVELIGYLDCRATSHNPDFPAGTPSAVPFYVVAAKKVAPGPRNSAYERRRYPLNEYVKALRDRYPAFMPYVGKAVERYMVLEAKKSP